MVLTVQKVTCFITRWGGQGTELLLFNHPHVGIQIPAGTVNPGEDVESGAIREAREESGLDGLVLQRLLGQADDPPPPGCQMIAEPCTVYSRPDTGSMDWVNIRLGTQVETLRQESGFTQVKYEETDRLTNPRYVSFTIIGWVLDDMLTRLRVRYFYLFTAPDSTPINWKVPIDNTVFELFWAPLHALPTIVHPQAGWVRWLSGIA